MIFFRESMLDDTHFDAPPPGKRGPGAAGKAKGLVAAASPGTQVISVKYYLSLQASAWAGIGRKARAIGLKAGWWPNSGTLVCQAVDRRPSSLDCKIVIIGCPKPPPGRTPPAPPPGEWGPGSPPRPALNSPEGG
jgi:hypothetical protein